MSTERFGKVLVTGASGSLGRQLLYELVRRGVRPITHVRESSNTALIDKFQLEQRVADLRQDQDLTTLVTGVDAIIHTAAYVNFRQDRLTQFTGINVFGALNLFRAAQRAGVRRFVHVSTVAAVGALPHDRKGTEGGAVNEDTPFNLSHLRIPYIMTKRAAEEELAKAAAGGQTELVTVNPSIVMAPSRSLDDRAKAQRRLRRLFLPDLPNLVNLVDIRDVAPGVLAALDDGRPGQRYLLVGENVSFRDLLREIASILDVTPRLVKVPRPLVMTAARAAAFWPKLAGKGKVSFYPDLVRMLDFDWAYSATKARAELGYVSRPLRQSLTDLLNNRFDGTYLRP